jgi:hypothetical protein
LGEKYPVMNEIRSKNTSSSSSSVTPPIECTANDVLKYPDQTCSAVASPLRCSSSDSNVCTMSDNRCPEQHQHQQHPSPWSTLSYEQRRLFGRKVKRILDYGRVDYMLKQGFHSRFVYYVSEHCSPENVLLLCWK